MESLQVKSPGRHLVTLALAVTALGLSACNQDPSKAPPKFRLEGSLTQIMDMGYDVAKVLVAPTDVSVLFVRVRPLGVIYLEDGGTPPANMQGMTEDYPLKVAYRLLDEPVPAGRIDLTGLDPSGFQRGTVSRNVANDPRNTLPLLFRGTLFFDRPLDPGTVVKGDFHVTFENGIDVASGRTAFSTSFSAEVQR